MSNGSLAPPMVTLEPEQIDEELPAMAYAAFFTMVNCLLKLLTFDPAMVITPLVPEVAAVAF